MNKDVQLALISAGSAIVGAILGAAAAWWAARITNKAQQQIAQANLDFQKKLFEDNDRSQRRAAIEAMILKLSEFAMHYPTVEKDDFCSAYPKCPGDANGKERYENYCSYMFNTIGAVWDFCEKDAAKVKDMLHVEELIKRHWRCWDGDKGNLGYDDPFRAYIQSIIDDLKRRKEIQ